MTSAACSTTAAVAVAAALAACAGTPAATTPAGAATADADQPFAWTLGDWVGQRVDGETDSGAPMTVNVQAVLDGNATFEQLAVQHERGVYRGATLQAFDTTTGRWARQYVNDVRGAFVRLEGELEDGAGTRSTWRVVPPGAERLSCLTAELLADGTWLRTMRVSADGGRTWRVLWRDELRRSAR
jgi:hypothetical protein